MSSDTKIYGWTAVSRSQPAFFSSHTPQEAKPVKVSEMETPSSPVVKQVQEYAKKNLPEETYNHSMRVFYYGQAMIRQHFPSFKSSLETYFLTCLLHDIGTTPDNQRATKMSFEWYGGFLALDLIHKECGAPKSQAESVCEAIIRHQDLGETGMITTVGQLIQLATIFDNVGINPHLIHKDTIEDVVKAYPRKKWSSCFAATIRKEIDLKPWCHTTVIDGFAEGVEGNKLMAPYDSTQ